MDIKITNNFVQVLLVLMQFRDIKGTKIIVLISMYYIKYKNIKSTDNNVLRTVSSTDNHVGTIGTNVLSQDFKCTDNNALGTVGSKVASKAMWQAL